MKFELHVNVQIVPHQWVWAVLIAFTAFGPPDCASLDFARDERLLRLAPYTQPAHPERSRGTHSVAAAAADRYTALALRTGPESP